MNHVIVARAEQITLIINFITIPPHIPLPCPMCAFHRADAVREQKSPR